MHAIATTALVNSAHGTATQTDQTDHVFHPASEIANESLAFSNQLEQELVHHLRHCAQETLSIPGFTQLHIEFERLATPPLQRHWNFSLGVTALAAPPSTMVQSELSAEGRWRLRLHAHCVENWIALDEAKLEVEVLIVQLMNLVASWEVRQQIRRDYCAADYWYGYSPHVRGIEAQLRKYAHVRLPVVLVGEKGTGKLPAALSLHCYRHAQSAPFIRSDCRAWEPGTAAKHLQSLAVEAKGGSLYLAHTECLKAQDQTYLRDFVTHLRSDFFLMLGSRCATEIDALSLPQASESMEWFEFHCLCLRLPRLQERRQDLRSIVQCYLAENQLELHIHTEAWEVLETYCWPENAHQLQSVLKKAVSLLDGALTAQDLLTWFPSMQLVPLKMQAEAAPESAPPRLAVLESSLQERRDSFHSWFGLKHPENEHPALMRALDHIWKHYQQTLTLNSVAEKACVSASHLSYLFKQRLQRSFKQILTEIRIDKAKHIFENMPARQITQVCMDVGFADLSHFEKTFKRLVGLKPRCYRQQFRQTLSTQA